jgi:serine/threonine protein kinase
MSQSAAGMLADSFGLVGAIVDGRYRVERVAGRGGFGVVYRAHHLGFDSPIALKVLRLPTPGSEARRRARIASFQREGRMLFELSLLHPAIVRAFETGTLVGGDGSAVPYLALEWLEGVSLERELCHRRTQGSAPFTLPEVLTLLAEPVAGLARAHARGIAHRDIKPANLFVTERDGEQQVKILDFGIAKLVGAAAEPGERPTGPLVATGAFTPLYAAPEQWLACLGATGPWTDVHALALVCVEMLTGRPALAGNGAELEAACVDAARRPTPGAKGLKLPDAVEAVFARALSREPHERFDAADRFWQALCQAAGWSPSERRAFVAMSARPLSEGQSGDAPAGRRSKHSSLGAPSGASTTAGTASGTGASVRPRAPSARVLALLSLASVAVVSVAWSLHGVRRARPGLVIPAENADSSPSAHGSSAPPVVDPPLSVERGELAPVPTPSAPDVRSRSRRSKAFALSPAPAAPAAPPASSSTVARPQSGPAPGTLPDDLSTLPKADLNLDDPALVLRK